jgi:RNA polymerase sigma-70 factor, ECF subfamily
VRDQSRSALAGELAVLNPELQISDATLVNRTLDGDKGAFEVLVRRHQSALYRRARWMGLDHDTASDMVQDSLIKAYESLGTCRDPDRFKLWVGRILRNKCLDFLKSAARRSVVLESSPPATSRNAEFEHDTQTLRKRLNEALAVLPEDQREAFLMKHGETLSYEEMAELTGISVSAMKMRVHRARLSLRESLESEM